MHFHFEGFSDTFFFFCIGIFMKRYSWTTLSLKCHVTWVVSLPYMCCGILPCRVEQLFITCSLFWCYFLCSFFSEKYTKGMGVVNSPHKLINICHKVCDYILPVLPNGSTNIEDFKAEFLLQTSNFNESIYFLISVIVGKLFTCLFCG